MKVAKDNDPFAEDELLTLVRLLNQVQDPTNKGPVAVNDYIDDHSVPCIQPLIDVHSAEQRTELRKELLEVPDESDKDATVADDEADDFDPPLRKTKFQSVREALAAADVLATFAEFHWNAKTSSKLQVKSTLSKMRGISLKQTTLNCFFTLFNDTVYVF